MNIKLFYGMKLQRDGKVYTVEKYWSDDTDPNSYKVRVNGIGYYSTDLKGLIRENYFVVVE